MTAAIVPMANALYLCDFHVGNVNAKVDLYGLFNGIQPHSGFPHVHDRFCVFVQLVNGLGEVPFFVDIRFGETDELVRTTGVRTLAFPDRTTTVQLVVTIEGCRFERPGMYLVELFCDNTWVCDAPLLLR